MKVERSPETTFKKSVVVVTPLKKAAIRIIRTATHLQIDNLATFLTHSEILIDNVIGFGIVTRYRNRFLKKQHDLLIKKKERRGNFMSEKKTMSRGNLFRKRVSFWQR